MECYHLDSNWENIIFDALGGIYDPNPIEASLNLNADEEKIKRYLGTYFPRSLAEQYTIWSRLLNNPAIVTAWQKRQVIRVIDIGSGTGGNLQGFLKALRASKLKRLPVEIYAVDGNEQALEVQRSIIEIAPALNITWYFVPFSFSAIPSNFKNHLQEISNVIGHSEFDIISSSKFISELYLAATPENCNNFYKEFLEWGKSLLASQGILLLVDVTIREHLHEYLPTILHSELHRIRNSFNLRTILPICCSYYDSKCSSLRNCYHSTNIIVTHRLKQNDRSKILFRAFTHDQFALQVLKNIGKPSDYTLISASRPTYCNKGTLVDAVPANTLLAKDALGREVQLERDEMCNVLDD